MKKYGLIGYPLSHSFSGNYFSEKFSREGITDCSYENFPISDIAQLPGILADNPELCGLNVTIPYKEKVLDYLDEADPVVKELGACNCLKIHEGKITGYNTDVTGFKLSLLERLHPHHRPALILGEGGAAKAVQHVLNELEIPFNTVSRKVNEQLGWIPYTTLDESMISGHKLIINCTPVGTFPDIEDFPPIPYDGIGSTHYLFDLIYNPAKTAFLQKGEERGALICNGLKMLIIQAEESWKIWSSEF